MLPQINKMDQQAPIKTKKKKQEASEKLIAASEFVKREFITSRRGISVCRDVASEFRESKFILQPGSLQKDNLQPQS